jgi:hypothetical protein
MKKMSKIFASVVATALIVFGSCSKDNSGNEPDPLPEIELDTDPATAYFTYAAGTANIEVFSNDMWTATVNSDAAAWCSVSPASGNGDGIATITVTANTIPSGGNRTATVSFTIEDVTKTVNVTQEVIAATAITQCLWNGSAWVDGYVTTHDYPFDDPSTTIGLGWSGNQSWGEWLFFEGAVSDKDGRANTAAITSVAPSAVQTCKDLGEGWYLPAYEELYNLSFANPAWGWGDVAPSPLNGLSGAEILGEVPSGTDKMYWSSTEFKNHEGRWVSTYDTPEGLGTGVKTRGEIAYRFKTNEDWIRCVWRP